MLCLTACTGILSDMVKFWLAIVQWLTTTLLPAGLNFNPLKCIWHEIFFFGFREFDVCEERFWAWDLSKIFKNLFFRGQKTLFFT